MLPPFSIFYPASGCAASLGGGPSPPNCAQATPAIVTSAPAILSQVNDSPSVSQAMIPAIGGIRYWKGAVRATPRTVLTQVHISQPQNDETTMPQKSPAHTAGPRSLKRSSRNEENVKASMSGAEKSSV